MTQNLSKYFPACSDFKITTNYISSKCKFSTSSTALFKCFSYPIVRLETSFPQIIVQPKVFDFCVEGEGEDIVCVNIIIIQTKTKKKTTCVTPQLYIFIQGGPVKVDSMWQHRLTRLVRDRYMYSIRITVQFSNKIHLTLFQERCKVAPRRIFG